MDSKISRRGFLRETSRIAAAAGAWTAGLLGKACRPKKEFELLIKNGCIVDLEGARDIYKDVAINRGRIQKIDRVPSSKAASVIDAKGKFILPGLCDLHVHLTDKHFLPLFLQNGVTCVRDVGNDPDFILPLRHAVNTGELLGPKIFAAGPILNNRKIPFGASFYTHVIKTPDQAKSSVSDLAGRSVDWIKIYISLPQNIVRTILQEAAKHQLPVAGHLRRVNARFAARWGIKTLEHTTGIAEALLTDRNFEDAPPNQTISNRAWLHVDRKRYRGLIDVLIQKDVSILANLTVYHHLASSSEDLMEVPHADLMPPAYQERWKKFLSGLFSRLTQEPKTWQITKEKVEEFVALFQERGGRVLAGTDTPWPYLVPGFSLHRELELLVDAGFTPREALLTATANAAEVLGESREAGRIQEGHRADLIILRKNPVNNIRNIRSLAAVVRAGRLVEGPLRVEGLP